MASETEQSQDEGRRDFLKGALAAGGAAATWAAAGLSSVTNAQAQPGPVPGTRNHYYVPATDKTVHWGYFSKLLKPLVEVNSGDFVTIEALTHHANDDAERMIKGDPGAESVYFWDRQRKGVDRRGAGPMQPTLFGRGAGEGLGVHICTGPVAVRGAAPGDILEVRIIDVRPRPCANPQYKGKSFGSNAAAWWGFHYKDLLAEPKPREVITIYEVDPSGERNWAQRRLQLPLDAADRSLRRGAQDHRLPGRAGGPPHRAGEPRRAEERPHSHPPALRRAGPGARRGRHRRFDPAAASRAATSTTGASARARRCTIRWRCRARCSRPATRTPAQGDSELCGTAIECSLTGTFQLILHKSNALGGTALAGLAYPLLETQDEWVLHGFSYPNYLAELGPNAQSEIYQKSSVDLAMRDAFRKMRHFLMTTQRAQRGRGDLADVGGGGLRRHPGRGRQLGRARHHQEEPLRGRLGWRSAIAFPSPPPRGRGQGEGDQSRSFFSLRRLRLTPFATPRKARIERSGTRKMIPPFSRTVNFIPGRRPSRSRERRGRTSWNFVESVTGFIVLPKCIGQVL